MNTRHSRNHSRKNEETEEKPQVARNVKYKKVYHWTMIWGHKSTIRSVTARLCESGWVFYTKINTSLCIRAQLIYLLNLRMDFAIKTSVGNSNLIDSAS